MGREACRGDLRISEEASEGKGGTGLLRRAAVSAPGSGSSREPEAALHGRLRLLTPRGKLYLVPQLLQTLGALAGAGQSHPLFKKMSQGEERHLLRLAEPLQKLTARKCLYLDAESHGDHVHFSHELTTLRQSCGQRARHSGAGLTPPREQRHLHVTVLRARCGAQAVSLSGVTQKDAEHVPLLQVGGQILEINLKGLAGAHGTSCARPALRAEQVGAAGSFVAGGQNRSQERAASF